MTVDAHLRPLEVLRLSVTDRCNLRCSYCMPEETYSWLPRADLLTFEELTRLARIMVQLGVRKVRLTGGEPLLRRDLDRLIAGLRSIKGLDEIALTTNGVLLADQVVALGDAGLDRLTVSLDTLHRDRFERLTRNDNLDRVHEGLDAARMAGFRDIKIDTVVMRGVNDDEIIDLLEFGRDGGHEVRFIEYMDVGGATRWSSEDVVSRADILETVAARFGPTQSLDPVRTSAPADRFALPDGTPFGIISSTTMPFCSSCNRVRLTADGRLFLCLYARDGADLREIVRSGASDTEVADRVAAIWTGRRDRGAEERLATEARGALASPGELRDDPHLEMHTRGG